MNSVCRHIILNSIPRAQGIGRPRTIAYEEIVDGIYHVLRTGCQWNSLRMMNMSWKTVYHYFSSWSKSHVFEKAYRNLLNMYLKRRGLSEHVVVDTSFVKNVYGRNCVGKSPVDRGRRATKVSALVDACGIPLQLLFHPGNKSDGKTLEHMLSKCLHIDLRGKHLYGDKAYGTRPCDEVVKRFQMVTRCSRRRQETNRSENRKRIVVEHFFGWIDQYRRIILRYDSLVAHFRSFHFLASSQLLSKRLGDQ